VVVVRKLGEGCTTKAHGLLVALQPQTVLQQPHMAYIDLNELRGLWQQLSILPIGISGTGYCGQCHLLATRGVCELLAYNGFVTW